MPRPALLRFLNVLSSTLGLAILCTAGASKATDKPPEVVPSARVAEILARSPAVVRRDIQGEPSADLEMMLSSDRRFQSGVFQAGASRFEFVDKSYGVDEFMLILSGQATLTNADGSVIELTAGDAVTIPAEWRGVWQTTGLTKYYVIYMRGRGTP